MRVSGNKGRDGIRAGGWQVVAAKPSGLGAVRLKIGNWVIGVEAWFYNC
ncbi:unnamed protein product [Prunus armeniaca]|uniref:Uncharacterized protein n=1 Tax=Prunus armeniaca TaxID=36596 RepID=A0A6J5VAI4_PRUAR|nr:unnamed protein product [Prunus armeniaca]